MLNLLTSRRTIRNLAGTVADAVRSVVNPAALVVAQQPVVARPEASDAPTEPATAPAGLYTADEMPAVEDIARAALGYDLAAESARSADRAKRKHRRLLDKLPTGLYGGWLVSREPSSRQVVDLAAVTAMYKKLGIGPVPMKPCAPSLKVERLAVDVEPAPAAELIAA